MKYLTPIPTDIQSTFTVTDDIHFTISERISKEILKALITFVGESEIETMICLVIKCVIRRKEGLLFNDKFL